MQTAFGLSHTIIRDGVRNRKGIDLYSNFNLAYAAAESLRTTLALTIRADFLVSFHVASVRHIYPADWTLNRR
jgi:hypothetical protein